MGAQNRRSESRADIPAKITVACSDGGFRECAVANLSGGGAYIFGARGLDVGETLRLTLELDGFRPLDLKARVVRIEIGGNGTMAALAFEHELPDSEDFIQDAVLSRLQALQMLPAVLVVDDDRDVREALARDLRSLDQRVIVAGTPLDAIRALQDQNVSVDLVIVDYCLGTTDGLEILSHVASERPDVGRVLMSGVMPEAGLLAAMNTGWVNGVLHKPWDTLTLHGLLLSAGGR